jgi:hypothetical protein
MVPGTFVIDSVKKTIHLVLKSCRDTCLYHCDAYEYSSNIRTSDWSSHDVYTATAIDAQFVTLLLSTCLYLRCIGFGNMAIDGLIILDEAWQVANILRRCSSLHVS